MIFVMSITVLLFYKNDMSCEGEVKVWRVWCSNGEPILNRPISSFPQQQDETDACQSRQPSGSVSTVWEKQEDEEEDKLL